MKIPDSRVFWRWVFATFAVLAITAIFMIAWIAVVQHQNKRDGTIDLVSLARKTRDAVVLIEVFDNGGNEITTGSGFFISADGLLVTNYHVIGKASKAVAKTASGDLTIKGAVVLDQENDLVLLTVDGSKLPYLILGSSENVEPGDHIAVIGSPLGLEASLSEGIISATRKQADEKIGWLQITAPISPGSSGSPVLNSAGKVIGIATAVLRGGQSLNFAVPVELAAGMLQAQREQPKHPLVPLQTFADLYAVDAGLHDLDVCDLASNQWTDAVLAQLEPAVVNSSEFRSLQGILSVHPDWNNVFGLAKSLIAKYPDSCIADAMLAHAYNGMGLQDEAVQAYQKAILLCVDSPYAWESLGLTYKQQGKAAEADFAFSQAITYQQKRVESVSVGVEKGSALMHLGDIYRWAGNKTAAKELYLRASQQDASLNYLNDR